MKLKSFFQFINESIISNIKQIENKNYLELYNDNIVMHKIIFEKVNWNQAADILDKLNKDESVSSKWRFPDKKESKLIVTQSGLNFFWGEQQYELTANVHYLSEVDAEHSKSRDTYGDHNISLIPVRDITQEDKTILFRGKETGKKYGL